MVKKEEAAREPVAASDVWGCVYNYFFMCGLFRLLIINRQPLQQ